MANKLVCEWPTVGPASEICEAPRVEGKRFCAMHLAEILKRG